MTIRRRTWGYHGQTQSWPRWVTRKPPRAALAIHGKEKSPTIHGDFNGKSHYKWGEFSKLPRFFVPEGMMGMCSSTHEKNCLWTQI